MYLNRNPYDDTDVTWNALRLAAALKEMQKDVSIFLMNDAVDLARESCKPPVGYDQDLKQMLKDLIAKGVPVEVCGSCMARCGLYRNEPYYEGANKSTMAKLAEWVASSQKVLTF
ncbi:MAG TPA: DsrE family protein [Fibrobacter sp.]|nr:DsrE family protein [Fibrobacter sp.]